MNIGVARSIVARTPMLEGIERVEHLDKGFSNDVKFILWEEGSRRYLLRLSSLNHYERRKEEFELLAKHHSRGIQCPEPHLFGVDEESGVCFVLLSYIEGECAEDALPTLTEREQFEIGLSAGRELRRLHELPCADEKFDWASHRHAKYMRNVNEIKALGVDFPHRDEVERCVEANVGLMKGRPSTFQHDDYHPGNLIIADGKLAGIVDFNRWDWGDPLHDFYKVPWFGSPVSVPFARGQIVGYFPGGIPGGFWPLYNLYVAMSFHASVCWVYFNERSELPWCFGLIDEIVKTHRFASGEPPAWFEPGRGG